MSTSKRERETARRRHEKWLARQEELRAQRRRRRVVAGAVAGTLVLVGAVALAVSMSRSGTQDTAERTVPDPSVAQGRTWTSTLDTSVGTIGLELDGAAAPQAVASFVTLAQEGYFDDTTCHRLTVEGIFVLQCGDPTATGQGGPGYSFGPVENAPADDVYPAGTLAMARLGGDGESMGSQFFLVYADSTIPADAAGGYTVFGQITDGMDVLQAVADAGIDPAGAPAPATEVIIKGVETQ
ncbi:peptidylprolyl isomerase [Actinotalea sp. K2]|uniref:peptidylprolyl isomerase n=1 Tax=Actinotalea sp. K2 TaxID=2939438 RepID=UPI002017B5BE|nr:peptidylprolyl isomerase [Actinotalea sp. K2]MCL3862323.1 peptidylprolyl isomerase [Actinotalea sp. K2]